MRRWRALVLDVVCVLVFVLVGRSSHAEQALGVGTLQTATPFLGALAVSVAVAAAARWPAESVWPAGTVVWVGTLALGMTMRAVFGGGVTVSFVVVAGTFLAATMLGWRLVARLAGQRRRQRRDSRETAAEQVGSR